MSLSPCGCLPHISQALTHHIGPPLSPGGPSQGLYSHLAQACTCSAMVSSHMDDFLTQSGLQDPTLGHFAHPQMRLPCLTPSTGFCIELLEEKKGVLFWGLILQIQIKTTTFIQQIYLLSFICIKHYPKLPDARSRFWKLHIKQFCCCMNRIESTTTNLDGIGQAFSVAPWCNPEML